MPKLPVVSARRLIKVLKKKGFIYDRTAGSHQIYFHPGKQKSISVPVHKSRDLGRGITQAILKDAEITTEEFLKLQ